MGGGRLCAGYRSPPPLTWEVQSDLETPHQLLHWKEGGGRGTRSQCTWSEWCWLEGPAHPQYMKLQLQGYTATRQGLRQFFLESTT